MLSFIFRIWLVSRLIRYIRARRMARRWYRSRPPFGPGGLDWF